MPATLATRMLSCLMHCPQDSLPLVPFCHPPLPSEEGGGGGGLECGTEIAFLLGESGEPVRGRPRSRPWKLECIGSAREYLGYRGQPTGTWQALWTRQKFPRPFRR